MSVLRLLLGLIVAVAVVSFGVVNMEPVPVTIHRLGTNQIPLFYVLLVFFGGGFLFAWLGGLFDRVRFYSRLRGFRKENRVLKRKLDEALEESGRLLPPAPISNGEASGQLQVSGQEARPGTSGERS